MGHSLPSRSAPGLTDVRYGPKATFQGKCPNGREVPKADMGNGAALLRKHCSNLGEQLAHAGEPA